MVTSKATVIAPSFATNQPSMSLDEISTSESSKLIIFPSSSIGIFPSSSIFEISSLEKFRIEFAIDFISLPNFGPKVLKFGLICFTKISEASSSNSISLMLTSCFIRFATAKIDAFCSSFSTGIIIFCKGWRTFIFSFARRDNTRDEIVCASSILRSSDLSM